MKIADPDSIKAGEQELINGIMETLNSEIIESIASGRLAVNNLEFRNGDMVIHEGRIVYKMEFETSVSVSVMFDRDGNLVSGEEADMAASELPDEPATDYPEDVAVEDPGDEFNVEDLLEAAGQAEPSPPEPMDTDALTDDGLENILEKNRDFWLEQTQAGMEPVDLSGGVDAGGASGDPEMQALLEKNRTFWEDRSEMPEA